MKIALLTDGITPYVIGGMQRHSFYLAKYLAKNEVYVDLFHFNNSDLEINDLECFTLDEKKYIKSIVLNFPSFINFPGHYIRESYTYSEIIFDHLQNNLSDYDFIYAKGFTAWKLIEMKNKGLKCPPIGVNFHGYEMFQKSADLKSFFQQIIFRKPVKWITQNADFVFSYGKGITQIIIELGLSQSKIIEIPTGIEDSWLNNTISINKVRHFVFVGRFERRKGIQELNAALKNIAQKHQFVFEFIGDIPQTERIIHNNIIYHGEIREISRIQTILKNSDFLICPSHSEGMPNVIMEAMASGLAIIASDVGAVSDMVDASNGKVIIPGNVFVLQSAIEDSIELSDEDVLKMKLSSIEKVKNRFLWKNVISLLIEKVKVDERLHS